MEAGGIPTRRLDSRWTNKVIQWYPGDQVGVNSEGGAAEVSKVVGNYGAKLEVSWQ